MNNQDPTAGQACSPGTRRVLALALLATTGLAAPLAYADQPLRAPTAMLLAQAGAARPAAAVQVELDALLKAAKAEGEVTFYISLTENVGKRVVDGFSAKYGIRTQFIRLTTAALTQRYLTEAEAGTHAADVVFNAGTAAPYIDTISKGWIEPISQAGIPVIKSGEFPAKFVTGATAIVQISPWLITYNTNSVKGSDIPKDWPDLLDAKWKGKILVGNPGMSDAYMDFWGLLHDKYGDAFFAQLRPNLRSVATGPQAAQGLGAGEGSFLVPAVIGQVQENRDKGAPLEVVTLDFTTGVEQHLILAARAKAKHPNAGRLLAHYLMSPEGNKVINDEPGGFTMYDTNKLPKQYQSPKPGAAARKDQVSRLLGF